MGTYSTRKRVQPVSHMDINVLPTGRADGNFEVQMRTGDTTVHQMKRCFASMVDYPCQETYSYRSDNSVFDALGSAKNPLLALADEKKASKWDNGHEFRTRKMVLKTTHPHWNARHMQYEWTGPLWPIPPSGSDNPLRTISFAYPPVDLDMGVKALNMSRPNRSEVDLTLAITELLRDIPQLPLRSIARDFSKGKRPTLKDSEIGSEGLNGFFGWAPLISDVLKTCEVIVNMNSLLTQYSRDSGKGIRRRVNFDSNVEFTQLPDRIFVPGDIRRGKTFFNELTEPYQTYAPSSVSVRRYNTYWFSGEWMYYLHEGSSFMDKMAIYSQNAKRLLGIHGLTPDLLWNLFPFSWMVDWFANVGTLLSLNQGLSEDNLVLRYGYLMRSDIAVVDMRHPGIPFKSGHTGEIVTSVRYEWKQRVRATPYGFGIKLESLTDSQWAILAFLGISVGDTRTLRNWSVQ